MVWEESLIKTLGEIITGGQNASVEAARIAAESSERRDQRDHEINKHILNTTREQLGQAQETLRETRQSNDIALEAMRKEAREKEDAHRRGLAELLKQQAEKEKSMSNASIGERAAMRKENAQARKEYEENIRRVQVENKAQIAEAARLRKEELHEKEIEIKRLTKEQKETVEECNKKMQEQIELRQSEKEAMHEAKMRLQQDCAEKVEGIHKSAKEAKQRFEAAMIGMTINQAKSKETTTLVELWNSLRDSLSDTRSVHHTAVEMARMAINDSDFAPASIHFGYLGQRVDQVDSRRAEFIRALNRANTSNKQVIAEQMRAIGHLELALCLYRTAIGNLRSKMNSSTPSIDQSDITDFNAVQLELTKKMMEMPLIDANDFYEEAAAIARQVLEGNNVLG